MIEKFRRHSEEKEAEEDRQEKYTAKIMKTVSQLTCHSSLLIHN